MNHFDIVQIPYYLQMLRAAMFALIALLIARQVAHSGITGLQRRTMVVMAELMMVADSVLLFIAFGAVGISAGGRPMILRDDVLMVIRACFSASAIIGIAAQVLLLVSMARLSEVANER